MAESPRKRAKISEDRKRLVIMWRAQGKSYEEISAGLNIAPSTAHGIIKRAQEDPPKKQPHGRPRKVDSLLHKPYIEGLLEEESTLTLRDIEAKCHDQFGIHFSLPTLCHALDLFRYLFKHVTVLAEAGETAANMEKRREYAQAFVRLNSADSSAMFFMDKVGFSLSMHRAYGYLTEGFSCHHHCTKDPVKELDCDGLNW